MTLSDICIVLTHPDESRNIGSACRAMANMGITKLRIVGKKEDYKDRQIRILAIHAGYIWDQAEFFNTITEATADCIVSAGTTRRRGKRRKEWLVTPEEFTDGTCFKSEGKIAVVFGNERTGLTDEELEECTMGIQIPSHPDFPSLNLSHAVQIMCYTLYRRLERPDMKGYTPISLDRLDRTVGTISDSLQKIGFFSVTGKNAMETYWKSILSRASLSEGEAAYLEKVFIKAAGLSKKNSRMKEPEPLDSTDAPENQDTSKKS